PPRPAAAAEPHARTEMGAEVVSSGSFGAIAAPQETPVGAWHRRPSYSFPLVPLVLSHDLNKLGRRRSKPLDNLSPAGQNLADDVRRGCNNSPILPQSAGNFSEGFSCRLCSSLTSPSNAKYRKAHQQPCGTPTKR